MSRYDRVGELADAFESHNARSQAAADNRSAARDLTEWDDRCLAVAGTVWAGPQFCGYKAKGRDANRRPCCGIHLGKQHGILWFGSRYRYPEGTDDTGREQWKFRHGAPRR